MNLRSLPPVIWLIAAFVGSPGCGRQPEQSTEGFLEASPENAATANSDWLQVAGNRAADLQATGASKLPIYELRVEPNNFAAMERSAFSNETVPAIFAANGEVYEGVRVRYRGAWARSWPKKPIKIFFADDKPFEDYDRLNLNSGWRDPALVRECLAYRIYAACGAPASKAQVIRLHLNGQFHGVYIQVEQPDKRFLARLNLKGASVYKANSQSNQADERNLGSEAAFRRHYEKQTKKKESYADLQQFCRDLAQARNVEEFFNQRVDVEKYINYLAATVLTQNWDGFNKNHVLVYDGEGSGKWLVLPWDLDRTLGDHWNWSFDETSLPIFLGTAAVPGVTGWSRLQDKFFSDPKLRARFFTRLHALLQTEFTPEKLFPILDELESQVGPDAALDRRRWPGPTPSLGDGIKGVKRFIRGRRAFLLRELQNRRL